MCNCGPNAICNHKEECVCIENYNGDPYTGCRPECTLNAECSPSKACINNRCVDPCPGICGVNANCDVVNHIPSCSCPSKYVGDPFTSCRLDEKPKQNGCNPSPCGEYGICRDTNGVATCSCQQGMKGSPPNCRYECVISAECNLQEACLNHECKSPCPGTCGQNANCMVRNHNPYCLCETGYSGDPFIACSKIITPPPTRDPSIPCQPSPCGPNSECKVIGNQAACSCLVNYIGSPPNCRPECTINSECPNNKACLRQKCEHPCTPGTCGSNAECSVINHLPICTCRAGYSGNPLQACYGKSILIVFYQYKQ